MSIYIKGLDRYVKHSNAAHAAAIAAAEAAEQDAASRAARQRLSPLPDRLARLLATLPEEVRREGLSLPTLVPLLRGRGGGVANAGQLGIALRSLGWRRERRWRGGDLGFSALWYPPAS